MILLFRVWCWTLRVHNQNPAGEKFFQDLSGSYILALWHGRIFYLFYHFRNRSDLHLLISPSRDGDFLARLADLMGYSVIRGSSFKKAVPSARALIKVLRRGGRIVIVADGSRGPRCQAQPGSLQIAGITDSPLIPMTFGAKHRWTLNSWDRFVIPYPFSRCTLNFGNPIPISARVDAETLKKKQAALEQALNRITLESE